MTPRSISFLNMLLVLLSLAFHPAYSMPAFNPTLASTLGSPLAYSSTSSSTPGVRLVHQFPNSSWIENIAVRANGSLLITEMTSPSLYHINPFLSHTQNAWQIASFPGHLGLLGITETDPDVFAVVAGNFSLSPPSGSTPKSYSLYSVDMTTSPPCITRLTDFPQASFLNGISYLPPPYNSLLLADSTLGVIFRYNLTNNETTTAIASPLLAKCSSSVLEGVNGMKLSFSSSGVAEYLYFTNAYCHFFGRLPIHPNGTALPIPPALASLKTPEDFLNHPLAWSKYIISRTSTPDYIFDDFVLYPPNPANPNWGGGAGSNVTAYLATGTENIITQVLANGMSSAIAGNLNSTEIVEPTGLAWGRTEKDNGVIYVTTGGGLGGPVWEDGKNTIVGGQVVALKI